MVLPEVLVVFGSDSDATTYGGIMRAFKEKNIRADLRVCSAHRTPKELEKIIKETKAKLIVAGAGLSAALPGCIAAQTTKPVIGVPVSSNYKGLDAMLSIHQMPPGIPVLGVGVEAAQKAVEAAERILKAPRKIKIVKRNNNPELLKRLQKAEETLKALCVPFETIEEQAYDSDSVFIDFFEMDSTTQQVSETGALVIFVPLLAKNSAVEAIPMLETTMNGLWVGIGRAENAAIAAAEIIGISEKKLSERLSAQRKEMREKVLKADEAERKKF